MNQNSVRASMAGLVLAGLLSACGGGGGGGAANPPPQNPHAPESANRRQISRNGIAIGPISTFGSVVVNGVRYDTSAATFTVNDVAATEADLDVGDVVLVVGTLDQDGVTGTASLVVYDDLVTGPVEAIDLATATLVVLGQTVLVTPDTSFDGDFAPASLAGVTVGAIVEVSGLPNANGEFVATRIEPEAPGSDFEVSGIVASLDRGASTFVLGNLVVDFSAAMLEDFPNGEINDGDLVEAKGAALGASGQLLADEVEFETAFPDVDDDEFVEIEGFITRFASTTDFDVSGFPVTTNANTSFEGGVAADLALNVKVEVDGVVNASGVLIADDIEFEGDRAVAIEATVDSVDAAAGSIVVLGITVDTDTQTRFEDQSDAGIDPLSVADINVGDYIELAGDENPAGSGRVRATRFEREDPETDSRLQGFVTAINEPSFTILGVTVTTDNDTEFEDRDGSELTSNEFFTTLRIGDLVSVSGTETAATAIQADDIEFESN